jgi:hypothetical protein
MATTTRNIGTHTSLTVTNLNSMANTATTGNVYTVGWQSARVDDRDTGKFALDYEVSVKLTMANTAAANDKAIYVFAVAWYYDGSSWYCSDGGTTTLPSGTEGTANSVVSTLGSNLKLVRVLNYISTQQVVQDTFNLSNAFGRYMPDGWSLILINYSGAAVAGSGNFVYYKAIKEDNA